jgi:diaminohydroxyphosphoribosylaminopyrimidine deaminase/5-amino-6-(5-phosphoribosylamino)uracil reductase
MSPAGCEALMDQALELALRGRGRVEPNPRVGALALAGSAVVGRGWHDHWGGPHAEIAALADAAARGALPDTLVVTLEPCSSERGSAGKKTEPCTRALLDAGIRRVVVGMTDPDPRHAGQGLSRLRRAGVEVVADVLAERCAELNRPFARALQRAHLPWTIAKWAMTMDGKTAAASGDARWVSSEAARRRAHELRSRVDAVVIGYRTAVRDDPELTVRLCDGPQALRVVVDPRAELPDDSRLMATAREVPLLVLVERGLPAARCARLSALGAELLEVAPAAPTGRRLRLDQAWVELRRRGLRRVLVEGGGRLLAELMEQGCVDQVMCFLAPKLIGGRSAPSPLAGPGRAAMAQAWRLDELHWEACGDDLLIGGFVA